MNTIDTMIDFSEAKELELLQLVNKKTNYGDFQFWVRDGLNEGACNISQNFSKSETGGEYMYPFSNRRCGEPLDLNYLLNREDTWLDIGGHIGLFAIRLAKQFPKIKEIISYEPLHHNVTFAEENLKINGVTNTKMVQEAIIAGEEEEIEFFISKDSGKHSTIQTRGREIIRVSSTNINKVLETYKPTAIKIDIEGAEYSLLKEIKDWSNIRLIIIEWHFNSMRSLKRGDKNARVNQFREIIEILEKNFSTIRKIPGVELGKNFITHFAAFKEN
jgi:FkbM family methyltransferase